MQDLAIFCYFKHEIQLFKVLLSLKVVKFETKLYLNFSNFRGRTSAGGGTSLGPKTGTSVRWEGGIGKIFTGWGDPPVPPRKKTLIHPLIIVIKHNQSTWQLCWLLGCSCGQSQGSVWNTEGDTPRACKWLKALKERRFYLSKIVLAKSYTQKDAFTSFVLSHTRMEHSFLANG